MADQFSEGATALYKQATGKMALDPIYASMAIQRIEDEASKLLDLSMRAAEAEARGDSIADGSAEMAKGFHLVLRALRLLTVEANRQASLEIAREVANGE